MSTPISEPHVEALKATKDAYAREAAKRTKV
jgi:hypothetical protein